MLSTASDQRQLLAELDNADVTTTSVRVLRAEADGYLDAYSTQERSLNEIEEVTEYSRTQQGESSVMPSSPPIARQMFMPLLLGLAVAQFASIETMAMPLHSETVVLSDDSSFAPSVLLEGGT